MNESEGARPGQQPAPGQSQPPQGQPSAPQRPGPGYGPPPQAGPGYGPPPQAGQGFGPPPGATYGPIPGGPQQPAGPYGQPPAGPFAQPGQYPPNAYPPQYAAGPAGPGGGVPKKSKLPLLLGIGAGALVLVVVLALVVVNALSGPKARTTTVSGPSGTTSTVAVPASANASDAVRGYLEAVAANDAEKALSYLGDPPADTAFLVRPVLEASSKAAPLTDIDVPAISSSSSYEQVAAKYKIGNRSVSEEFAAQETGGTWTVQRGVVEMNLESQRDETLKMFINGLEVTSDTVSLFPGTYSFTTDSKFVSYGKGAKATFTGPSDYDRPNLQPALSSVGRTAFLKKVRSEFTKCLAQRKLKPTGCPNRIKAGKGQKITQSSIHWSVTKDPFRNAKPRLDYQDPTIVELSFYPDYNFEARGSQDGRSVRFDGRPIGFFSSEARGDLSKPGLPVKFVRG